MVRHNTVVSMLRVYDEDSPDPYADYEVVCTLVWDSKHVVWVHGLRGRTDRRMLKKMLEFFLKSGIKTIKAHRADRRRLPGGVLTREGYTEIDVLDLARRVKLAPT